jgi:hypothetical protein
MINYISDFTFENVKSKVSAHLNYIKNGAENTGGRIDNLDMEKVNNIADAELSKRKDSRIMLKFNIALDNQNIIKPDEVKKFISEQLKINPDNIITAEHLISAEHSKFGNDNRHLHIAIIPPRDINNKKLRLTKTDLSNFHKNWKEYILSRGLEITESPEKMEHIGIKLNYDKDAQETYKSTQEIKELDIEKREIEKRIDATKKNGMFLEIDDKLSIFDKINLTAPFSQTDKAVVEHLNRLFYDKSDKLSLIAINKQGGQIKQESLTAEQLVKKLPILKRLNSQGFDIYHSVNVLLPDSTAGRLKSDFREFQNRIYIDLDNKNDNLVGKENLKRLDDYLKKYKLPDPNQLVKSSTGNYQAYWILDKPVEFTKLQSIMRKINTDLKLDYTQDISRVFRLPGFYNKKPRKNDIVENMPEQGFLSKNYARIEDFNLLLKDVELKYNKLKQLKPKPLDRYNYNVDNKRIAYLKDEINRKRWIDFQDTDLSRADIKYAMYLHVKGKDDEYIKKSLIAESPDIEKRHTNLIDYLERTVRKAIEFVINNYTKTNKNNRGFGL